MPSSLKRYHSNGDDHFVTFSCYRRESLFLDDALRAYFLLSLERLRSRHRFMVFGYVPMPEHVHLLVSEPRKIALPKVIGSLKTAVSRRSSRQHVALWQRRYDDFNVLTHAKFVEKLQYMHRNPVQRGLVEKPEQYRWSSFNHWLTGRVEQVEIESHWTSTINLEQKRTCRHPDPPMTKCVSWVGHRQRARIADRAMPRARGRATFG